MDIGYMKRKIVSMSRVDLEQAAAVILSAIANDDTIKEREELVHSLLKRIDHSMLVHSCMWMAPSIAQLWQMNRNLNALGQHPSLKLERLVQLLHNMLSKQGIYVASTAEDWASVLPILLRSTAKAAFRTRLDAFHPQWIFEDANALPPVEYKIWDTMANVRPATSPPPHPLLT